MLFSSLTFLFVFLPVLLVLYFAFPKKWRNGILLLSSILFYAWGGVSYTAILILSILFNFLFVKGIEKAKIFRKTWLIVGLTFNVVVIVVFKYLDFIIENINSTGLFFTSNFEVMPLQGIILPLGISFFTFQQMSLLWDVYREPNIQKTSIFNTALYISLFPQLIAGPIVRYNDIIDQIRSRNESVEMFRSGVQRFILGLFKKIVFANSVGLIADSIMDANADFLSTPVAWLGILAYALQIYFDFSGYSDMAIGLGRMFGFNILENFNFPYISTSIQEFWRRWHISLSTWFRDYVYIPLGGNRVGKYRTYYNLLIVFLLTGFWHGATWSFVAWGLFHGVFLMVEKIGFGRFLNRIPKIFGLVYTLVVVLVGWVLFRIEEIPDAYHFVLKMFGIGEPSDLSIFAYLDSERITILVSAILFSSPILLWLKGKLSILKINDSIAYRLILDGIYVVMFVYSVLLINSGSFNPFIYFRF